MRRIPITDKDGHLASNAISIIDAFATFPDSSADREQYISLATNEAERYQDLGSEAYEPSLIFRTITEKLDGSSSHRFLCGLVTIVLCLQHLGGKRVSVRAASRIVADLTGTHSKVTTNLSWLSGEVPPKRKWSIPCDDKDIAKRFRAYRSVAHICAASVSIADHIEPTHQFAQCKERDKCAIQTTAVFERLILDLPNADDWNLWRLSLEDRPMVLPAELRGYPPLMPSRDFLSALNFPASQSFGLVNRIQPWGR